MAGLGDLLHADHLRTLAALDALEGRILGEGRSRPVDGDDAEDRRLVDEMLATIDYDTSTHFRFEETILFPLLEQGGVGDMTRLLTEEHAAIRELADQLRTAAAQALTSGRDAKAWNAFRYAAMDLIHSMLFHIQKEEISLVRRLGFLVKSEVDQELARQFAESRR
jgi:hemerythrin-like domain-containing protein